MNLGDRVVDVSFRRPDGSECRLSDFAGAPLLLVFIRHLA
jgi:peroxiredoxin